MFLRGLVLGWRLGAHRVEQREVDRERALEAKAKKKMKKIDGPRFRSEKKNKKKIDERAVDQKRAGYSFHTHALFPSVSLSISGHPLEALDPLSSSTQALPRERRGRKHEGKKR